MAGWSKIIGCCKQAVDDGLEYAWIDSCCIDKTSSAEFSEAINSMFHWYQDAEICYAYLSDVEGTFGIPKNRDPFRFSKWLTRGWTLQELVAPDNLVFFDSTWHNIGTKEDLEKAVRAITGIQHLFNFEEASTAQNMSWASKRETTRIEDMAYCLMGLFGVNMPPLYVSSFDPRELLVLSGMVYMENITNVPASIILPKTRLIAVRESQGTFIRLQLEIMRASNDESQFAWEDTSVEKSGLLASSPASCKYSEDIESIHPQAINRAAYSMTNKVLQIDFNLTPFHDSRKRVLAPLYCCRNNGEGTLIAVILSKDGLGEDSFERTACGTSVSHPIPTTSPNDGNKDDTESLTGPRSVFIKQPHTSSNLGSTFHFKITFTTLIYRDFRLQARQLANPELGRWAKDKVDEIGLKLANNVAVIQFNRHSDKFVL